MTIYCLNFGLRLKILFISKVKTNLVFSKLEQLKQIMQNKVDILVLTETKIDFSFSNHKFCIDEFCLPFRLDRSIHRAGILT